MLEVSVAVAADLSGRYLIAYTPSDQHKDGAWRKIAVQVPGDYVVRTREGYFAPDPPPGSPVPHY